MSGHRKTNPAGLRPREFPFLGPLLFRAYGVSTWRMKQFIRWLLYRLEGGSVYSVTLRRIFSRHHGIEVGDYTHGGWIHPFHIDEGTTIGSYSSIAETARALTHNHPLKTRSTSGVFFNPVFGVVAEDHTAKTKLSIGSDVWIGHNAVLLPSVDTVGHGAVIGAGAVVGRDVPPYAIVHGNPGRVIGYRFGPDKIKQLLAECWWERPLVELHEDTAAFLHPLREEADAGVPASGQVR